MMAEEVIGLLFGVEGIGVDGASGKEIVAGLTRIVNEINGGKSSVPKIKFRGGSYHSHGVNKNSADGDSEMEVVAR